jgi:hypothetical protein
MGKPSSGMARRLALLRIDVSKECIIFIIRVKRIGEVGATLAVTSNRSTVFIRKALQLLVIANVVHTSLILFNTMMEEKVPPKRRFLQEPHGVPSQKTPFFIVTSVK